MVIQPVTSRQISGGNARKALKEGSRREFPLAARVSGQQLRNFPRRSACWAKFLLP